MFWEIKRIFQKNTMKSWFHMCTYPPLNGFGAAGFWFCAKFPKVIAEFSDEPRLSNSVFFCGDVNDVFVFILANVPNPPFGLPNVAADPNVAEPNVAFDDAWIAPNPKPAFCCCCGDPNGAVFCAWPNWHFE